MTEAEEALQEFARTNRLRVTGCHNYSPNLGELALLQARFSRLGRRVTLRAAVSLLEVELRIPDRAFAFAINRPDRVCGLNLAEPELQSLIPWPVFVADSGDLQTVSDWLRAYEHRDLIEGFGFSDRESVQIYINGLIAVVESTRAFNDVADRLISLAERLPPAPATQALECSTELPEDLQYLHQFFAQWAISDDEERQDRIARSTNAERAQLHRVVEPSLARG